MCLVIRRASSGPRDSFAPYDTFDEFATDIRSVFSKAISYHGGVVAKSSDVPTDPGEETGQQVRQS